MKSCVICGTTFTSHKPNQTSCSHRCNAVRRADRERRRRAALRSEASIAQTCAICSVTITVWRIDQRYCEPCSRARKSAVDTERKAGQRAAARVGRICADCASSIAHRTLNAKYCEPCADRRDDIATSRSAAKTRKAAEASEARESRTCLDCKVSIARRRADAVRCNECVRKGKLAANVERLRVRRAAAGAQSKAKKPTTTKAAQPTTAAPKRERVHREKPTAMRKPNLDGDWFPGWRGQYPSRYTDEDIARIEHGRQLLINDDKTRHQDREGRTYRYSDFGNDHPIYPEERAS